MSRVFKYGDNVDTAQPASMKIWVSPSSMHWV